VRGKAFQVSRLQGIQGLILAWKLPLMLGSFGGYIRQRDTLSFNIIQNTLIQTSVLNTPEHFQHPDNRNPDHEYLKKIYPPVI
jgi:hypothetical protein